MSVSYFVFYQGQADDHEGFIERYRSVHIPILQRWPGVEHVILHTPIAPSDPKLVSGAGFAMMAEIVFRDDEALAQALQSPERHEARLDFEKFPTFHGAVTHQAMQAEKFSSSRLDR